MPVKPPMVNRKRNTMAYSMGVFISMEPLYMVASQLNIFIPVGIPTKNVRKENTILASYDCPAVNMWCPQTRKTINAIASEECAIAQYPKIVFLENVEITSDITPKPGTIIMYTAGCE